MNPVMAELLNSVEKYHRSKQVEACQLLKQARMGRSGQPSLLERVVHGLGTLLIDEGQRLKEMRSPHQAGRCLDRLWNRIRAISIFEQDDRSAHTYLPTASVLL